MNEDTSVGVASVVVYMMVEMEKLSSLEDATILGSFPPLSTPLLLRLVMPL
ncbi:hypothetical protein Tco_1449353, partial [Tanacetum coccineum]